MLREEANDETKYVEAFCENLGIQCFSERIDVQKLAKNLKKGTEETARQVRYEFFNNIGTKVSAKSNNEQKEKVPLKVATAHNNNDKIETIIMNMLRGSGMSGLKGIPHVREEKYIRPLLEVSREEIENYCDEHALCPMHDKSNDENIYTRNKVRNIAIPYIQEEFNPNIFKSLNRLSELVAEEDEYLSKVTKEEYEEIVSERVPLDELEDFNLSDDCISGTIVLKLKEFRSVWN